MTSRFVRTFLSCLLLLALASPSFAARRSSLAGNLLIRDMDDMFIFPHLVVQHKRMVTFDLGTNDGLGSGGLVFGDEDFTFGAFAHRSDFLGAVPNAFFTRGDIDNIGLAGTTNRGLLTGFPGFGPSDGALNFIDALFGWKLGDTPWGVRVSLGRNQQDDPNHLVPVGPNQGPATVTTFNGVVGFQTMATDVSGEFSVGSSKTKLAGATDESTPFEFSLAARKTATEDSDALTLGWLGMFTYFTAGVDHTPAAGAKTTNDNSGYAVDLGVGPVYRPNDRTNVAMYGTFDIMHDKTDDNTTKVTTRSIGVPGWNVAAEVELASWLQFRAGLRSRFEFLSTTSETAVPPKEQDKDNNLSFQWTSGVGVHINNFRFDGYLDPSVLTNGTSLLGADGNHLFGMVTASLDF